MSVTDVETTTNAVANTSISAPEENPSTIAAAEGRRLYIGNLNYVTSESQLRDFFSSYNVESVSIPTNPRIGRPVGYAFVDVATKEEADKAILELSGKEILERKVSVQIARKPGTGPPRGTGINGESAYNGDKEYRPRRGRGGFRGRGRGRGGRRRAGSTRATTNDGPAATATPAVETPVATAAEPAKAEPIKATIEGGEKPALRRRKRGPPENGVASTTKVMVANLPYELSEAALKEIFAAYDPESAKIALRPIPRFMVRKLQARGEPRKGRGFGFVTLPSEEMQKKAVEEMNGKVVEGREIAVKVAIDNPKPEEGEGEAIGGEGATTAPTNGTTDPVPTTA